MSRPGERTEPKRPADPSRIYQRDSPVSRLTAVSTSAQTWLAAFAEAIGAPPLDEASRLAILELAGEAAHGSERTAAPVACWLAASAGLSPSGALDAARALEIAKDPGTT